MLSALDLSAHADPTICPTSRMPFGGRLPETTTSSPITPDRRAAARSRTGRSSTLSYRARLSSEARRPNLIRSVSFAHRVRAGEPLYVACGFDGYRAHIITVHWMDPEKWIDWRTRRS